jgi:hypothetical protein
MELTTILGYTDILATFITIFAVVYIFLIAKVTGWFKAWIFLTASFMLIVVRRIVTAIIPFVSEPLKTNLGATNSVLQIILSLLYVTSFYLLYQLFKSNNEIHKNRKKK